MVGTTIAHYEVLEKLGEGGMGVVYKARDTKLERMVALKFLPSRLNPSEQDKARFTQEAKAAAALNHPNVCSILDIQEHDGQMFLVMEFVDGATLRSKEGTVSFKQAIDIGIQIADGLAAAHEKGVVHRDIKPENIMVRKDGICQIMDFGLAKLRSASSKVNRLTQEGSTVGTAGYMSPEQVTGQDADHRADIFSLGVVLYELFTGALPFKGVHETALMYEIVNVDPPTMSSVKAEIDPTLDAIVMECLAKEPGERFQSVAEVGKELRRFKRESSRSRVSRVTSVRSAVAPPPGTPAPAPAAASAAPAAAPAKRGIVARFALPAVAGILLLGCLALGYLYWNSSSVSTPQVRFTIDAPDKGAFSGDAPMISPDGSAVTFIAADSSGKILLWVRPLASFAARPLVGTDGAQFPFWSPDGRAIAFFQNGKLKRIDAAGGPPQTIADAQQGRGGSWSPAGIIIYSPTFDSGIWSVSEGGGTPKALSAIDTARLEDSHRWPCFLPDGRHFLYLRRTTDEEGSKIVIGSLDGEGFEPVLNVRSSAVYAAPGYLLYARDFNLIAQRFDPETRKLTGQPVPIADDVGFDQAYSHALLSASANGVLAFDMGSGTRGNRQFVWFDRTGKRLGTLASIGSIFDMSLSPNEQQVAFRRIDATTQNQDVWITDVERGTESRFTFAPATDDDPTWSPDGKYIVFDSRPNGVPNLYRKLASGIGAETLLVRSAVSNTPLGFSNDGRYLLYQSTMSVTKEDIWVLPMNGDSVGTPWPYQASAASEYSAKFSPDGRWVAYTSDESGRYEIYVQAFPTPSGKWQVSVNGGGNPMWSKDGKELYYISPDRKLMAVEVDGSGSTFKLGIPAPLFQTEVDIFASVNRYAVTTGNQRFLVNSPLANSARKPVAVIMNWTAGVEKR